MTGLRRLRWWMREGIPERLHRLRYRLNPWAQARQYRTERDAYKRWLHDCEGRLGE